MAAGRIRRLAVGLGLVCASALIVLGGAAPARGEEERARSLAVARQIVQKARYCAFVTNGRDGQPQARVVDPLPPEPDFTIWIGTNPVTRKVAEIRADPRVTLFYFDAASKGFVTILGSAELVSDPVEKERRFKADWAPFYRDAHRGADFLLVRVRPKRLEIVSEADGIVNDPATWRPTTVELP
jgi:general stress protein 26